MIEGLTATAKIVRGQRRCVHCAYGLTGQPVLRDGRYDLLLARCPECGRMACFEQEPLLGRGARVLGVLLGGLLIAVLIGVWWIGGYGIGTLASGTSYVATYGYASTLNDQFRAAAESDTGAAIMQRSGALATASGVQVAQRRDFSTWWEDQDPAAQLAAAGGRIGAIEPATLLMAIPMGLVSLSIGAFWSVVLFRWRGLKRLAVVAVLIAPAVAIAVTNLLSWLELEEMRWAGDVALRELGPIVITASMIFQLVTLVVGLIIGRRIARGLIRLTVPRRLRSPFAPLWYTDGLEPPLATA